jgi:hypothetical protein
MKTIEKIVNEYGNKIRQRKDNEDRTIPYRNMIYGEDGLYAIDQDLICVSFENEIPEARAVLELTRIDDYSREPSPNYFKSILKRYSERDRQKYLSVWFANMLKAPVYIVAFAENLNAFHMYNLTEDNGNWFKQNKLEHLEWHYNIRSMEVPYYIYEKYKQKPEIQEDPFADLI